ncbi:MAG: helix-turn-helix domain-containing protein, partial [Myxococcota bacterium]
MRGVSLDELAQLTKIPFRSLERLESGAFDAARDGFVRGFVRTVAEALGLDPGEAVMRLLQEPRAEPEADGKGGAGMVRRLPLLPLAGLAAVTLAAVLVWQLVSFWMSPAAEPSSRQVLLRRDPVRELAREVEAA